MKTIKYLIFLLLLAAIAFSVYVAVQPADYDVSRTKVINASPAMIFENLNDYRNWETWGPWLEEDPEMKFTYPENTAGPGGSYSWTGKDGKGSMETLATTANVSLDQTLSFDGSEPADVYWRLNPKEEATEITWGMKGKKDFMFKAISVVSGSMDNMLGPMFERGLERIDSVMTADIKKHSINFKGKTSYGGGYYLYSSGHSKHEEVGEKMAELFPKVMAYAQKNGIKITGEPKTIYNEWNEENKTAILSAAFPVKEKINTLAESDILCGFTDRGDYFKGELVGNYGFLPQAWQQTMEAIKKGGLEIDESRDSFEVYLTGPNSEVNPSKWHTEIYVPIKS